MTCKVIGGRTMIRTPVWWVFDDLHECVVFRDADGQYLFEDGYRKSSGVAHALSKEQRKERYQQIADALNNADQHAELVAR